MSQSAFIGRANNNFSKPEMILKMQKVCGWHFIVFKSALAKKQNFLFVWSGCVG